VARIGVRDLGEIDNVLPERPLCELSRGYLRREWEQFFTNCTPEEKAFWEAWSQV
jgi:hypothetical protein